MGPCSLFWAGDLVSPLPDGSDDKESTCSSGDAGSSPGLGRSLAKEMATAPVFLPGGFHGQNSLAGHNPCDHKWDKTEQYSLSLSRVSLPTLPILCTVTDGLMVQHLNQGFWKPLKEQAGWPMEPNETGEGGRLWRRNSGVRMQSCLTEVPQGCPWEHVAQVWRQHKRPRSRAGWLGPGPWKATGGALQLLTDSEGISPGLSPRGQQQQTCCEQVAVGPGGAEMKSGLAMRPNKREVHGKSPWEAYHSCQNSLWDLSPLPNRWVVPPPFVHAHRTLTGILSPLWNSD